MNKYQFCSERLGFRNWLKTDIAPLYEINLDPAVMEYFPALPTLEETKDFVRRMQLMNVAQRYCYFAVDELETSRFIGFIGLSDQDYPSPYTPCVDIGWRLHKDYWGLGYATEGARRCLDYGFTVLELPQIRSIAPVINKKSIRVMEKIGMHPLGYFEHPKLKNFPKLKSCICYEMGAPE